MSRITVLTACFLLSSAAVIAAEAQTVAPHQAALEKAFDADVKPAEMMAWDKAMASEPNNVGAPHDKANAEWELAQFQKFGWDAHIETFSVLYPTPIHEEVTLLGKKPFHAMLTEPPIPGDTSARAKSPGLPAYFAYQGDGDVTAPLVYVNYGMQDDYKELQRLGVSVKGKIVIARYGAGWRGLKPKLAYDHGAIGCIVYSDPKDDGYAVDATYPNGPARPPHGIQRGSVEDMTTYAGDPLTPGVGATPDAKRLTREESPVILKIPAIPISYADAQPLLASLDGRTVPANWRGALPLTYRVGPSTASVHLVVKSDWSQKTIYDVIATMKGSEYPDQWVVRGNHRDGWVFGASDPLSGQVSLLEEARIIGDLVKQGWHPKRTLVYASWDGEEPGLLGSTEWAETHADELKQKAVVYINTDDTGRGFFGAGGNQDLEHFVNTVADDVTDPETNVSIEARRRAEMRLRASEPDASERAKEEAKDVADPANDSPIEALGSGSDYSSFLEHLGLAALDFGFGGEGGEGGVYHSRYDTYEYRVKWIDPGFVYTALLTKTIGRVVLRLADTELPVVRETSFANEVSGYLADVKKLADGKRKTQETQAKLLADRVYRLTADPTKTSGLPTALQPVPKFDFAPMDDAVAKLKEAAKNYDNAFANGAAKLSPDARGKLWSLMQTLPQTLAPDNGLPGRTWYKNLIYAPGRFTGYGVKTIPGIREAIEEQRWSDVAPYMKLTADALNAYSARLDQATAVLKGD
ncbi:MAG: transferrin receptor-like dimerization domain-containing protein [Rhizomicrobium sp.]